MIRTRDALVSKGDYSTITRCSPRGKTCHLYTERGVKETGLRLMLLEDEPEGATLSERGDLCFQISTKLRIGLVRLPQQLRQSRQWCALLVRTDAN